VIKEYISVSNNTVFTVYHSLYIVLRSLRMA